MKIRLLLVALALGASSIASAQNSLLNVSYGVAREFYKEYNPAFVAHYKKTTGKDVKIDQSHAGSSAQARAVNDGLPADVVVIDCPNRQGGPLTLSALNAADTVVYAATATSDGIDGVEGARRTVAQFRRHRQQLGAPNTLTEAGIVVGGVKETIMSRAAVASLDELRATGLFLEPLIPDRAIVQEVRISGEWYGQYRKGSRVLDAYTAIAKKVLR